MNCLSLFQAKQLATHNVEKFFVENRDNQAWDDISSVIHFKYSRHGDDVYSPLQKWVKDQENENSDKNPAIA